jgi:hypothetical protein
VKSENAKRAWGYCDAKMQKTPEYQEFAAECEERKRKPYERSFTKWLAGRIESPEAKAERVVKIITSPS